MNIASSPEGKRITEAIYGIFAKHLDSKILSSTENRLTIKLEGKAMYTTKTFVAEPVFFKGGDLGRLAVCSTVNSLSIMGAIPKYLTAGFIISKSCEPEMLERIVSSMVAAAKEAKIKLVAGDIKVIEGGGGIYINTSGIGEVIKGGFHISNCKLGDVILVTGNLGEHEAAIKSAKMNLENNIQSDCAPMISLIKNLLDEKIRIRCMREINQGGLAAVLHEIAGAASCRVVIEEKSLPISKEVRSFCESLSLDPLYLANEGKLLLVLPNNQADKALAVLKNNKYGKNAAVIGAIVEGQGVGMRMSKTGSRTIDLLEKGA